MPMMIVDQHSEVRVHELGGIIVTQDTDLISYNVPDSIVVGMVSLGGENETIGGFAMILTLDEAERLEHSLAATLQDIRQGNKH